MLATYVLVQFLGCKFHVGLWRDGESLREGTKYGCDLAPMQVRIDFLYSALFFWEALRCQLLKLFPQTM